MIFNTIRDNQFKLFCIIAISTGMRRGEIWDLKSQDINWRDGTVLVDQGKLEGQTEDTEKLIFFHPKILIILREYIVLNNIKGRLFTYTPNQISDQWAALMKILNIENLRLHDLRHTFSSKLASMGIHPMAQKELLGHTTAEMTQRYTHFDDAYKRDAINKIDLDSIL